MPLSGEAKAKANAINSRYHSDAIAILQLAAEWRGSPRKSKAHKEGWARFTGAMTEVLLGWERDGIPIPKVGPKAMALANARTIMGHTVHSKVAKSGTKCRKVT